MTPKMSPLARLGKKLANPRSTLHPSNRDEPHDDAVPARLRFSLHSRNDWRCRVANREYCIRKVMPGQYDAMCNGQPLSVLVYSYKTRAAAIAQCHAHEEFLAAKARYRNFCVANRDK